MLRSLVSLALLSACATNPAPRADALGPDRTVFSYAGFEFAALVEHGVLRVRVPCCQTYTADGEFRDLLLRAVEDRLGCRLARPVFTPGWLGPWQMTAPFECEPGAAMAMEA